MELKPISQTKDLPICKEELNKHAKPTIKKGRETKQN